MVVENDDVTSQSSGWTPGPRWRLSGEAIFHKLGPESMAFDRGLLTTVIADLRFNYVYGARSQATVLPRPSPVVRFLLGAVSRSVLRRVLLGTLGSPLGPPPLPPPRGPPSPDPLKPRRCRSRTW